ncbi:hypothetical protein HPB49_025982 [Dermacentor silvarum]|nr:hypothetical protein HPB49_025982 [Dermacentor silvarum]
MGSRVTQATPLHFPDKSLAGVARLLDDLHRLMEDRDSADVVFLVGREEAPVYAHCLILRARAASYFLFGRPSRSPAAVISGPGARPHTTSFLPGMGGKKLGQQECPSERCRRVVATSPSLRPAYATHAPVLSPTSGSARGVAGSGAFSASHPDSCPQVRTTRALCEVRCRRESHTRLLRHARRVEAGVAPGVFVDARPAAPQEPQTLSGGTEVGGAP